MKATLRHTVIPGVILLTLLLVTIFGQVKISYAQTDTEWSDSINLSNSGASTDPSIVVDSAGVIHVIWVDAVDGYKYVFSKDGVSWSKPVSPEFPFNPETDSRPILVADSSGSIHMFWTRTDERLMTGVSDLYYARTSSIFFSQPLSWASVDVLANQVLDFDVMADSRSVIHLSYVRSFGTDDDPAGIFYRRSEGITWSPAVRLYSSQYFRTLHLEDSHVRLAVSGGGRTGMVYAVWDDRPTKRIFMAKSTDGGVNWEQSIQLHGPEDATGLSLPYNVNVSATGSNVLLTWQLGQPGANCLQYSQWSVDGGENFTVPTQVIDELGACPATGTFVGRPPGYFLMMLDLFGDLSLVAWNGSDWSLLETQSGLNVLINPLTMDNVVLGCQQITSRSNILYMVGCDRIGTGDIWFRSRTLGSLNDWFPDPSRWTGSTAISGINQDILSIASVANENGTHLVWVQYSTNLNGLVTSTVQYAFWEAGDWSLPTEIFPGVKGIPNDLTAIADRQGGILIAWVRGENGEIYFSRANGEKAYLASEWAPPLRIPSLSELNSTPDMLVDSSNKIVLVYSIPFNEYRGIYLVQSEDFGRTWSQPVRIFDAVESNWDSVTDPKLELSEDGRLHLLFTRNSFREEGRQADLYYMQSADGGAIWTSPEAISDGVVQWSELASLGTNTLFRLWQEKNGSTFELLSDVSNDRGLSWSGPSRVSDITSLDNDIPVLTLAKDSNGQMYVVQSYIENDRLVVEELHWDSSRWNVREAMTATLSQEPERYFTTSGITTDRVLHYLISIDYAGSAESTESVGNEILWFSRILQPIDLPSTPSTILIPTPVGSAITLTPEPIPTLTQSLPSERDGVISGPNTRNLIGLVIISGIVILTLIFVRPWARRKSR